MFFFLCIFRKILCIYNSGLQLINFIPKTGSLILSIHMAYWVGRNLVPRGVGEGREGGEGRDVFSAAKLFWKHELERNQGNTNIRIDNWNWNQERQAEILGFLEELLEEDRFCELIYDHIPTG